MKQIIKNYSVANKAYLQRENCYYQFKNVNKWYLALYGAVLAISVLIGAFLGSLSQSYNSNNAVYFIFFL